MFCVNPSSDTQRILNNCSKYCPPSQRTNSLSYNQFKTEKSQQSSSLPENHNITERSTQNINQTNAQAFQILKKNADNQNRSMQPCQRNKKICEILSTILAFSQRIQTLKQKLCGYPAQSFSPVQFFNVLDITEKGYVDLYDIKRFISNDKIRDKDIITLFKRVNGDHTKDNTRLTYFGYLTLVKPYFNEELARDLLLRDSHGIKKSRKLQEKPREFDEEFIQPTQQSVLLLFQEIILLHCICTTEHEQAKQALMNDYLLNTIQIKQLVGFEDQNINVKTVKSQIKNTEKQRNKSALWRFFEFIENNSEFEVEFNQMKFLLSFLNVHQFSLSSDKSVTLLFLPISCKKQLHSQIRKSQQLSLDLGTNNYMNTYLNKQDLSNKGDIQVIRNFLEEKSKNSIANSHLGRNQPVYKTNFLDFVHPKSIQRINQYQVPSNNHFLPNPSQPQNNSTSQSAIQQARVNMNAQKKFENIHHKLPQMIGHLNPKNLQYSNNSSSIPQQDIKIIPPRQTYIKQDFNYNIGLNNQFFEEGYKDQEVNHNLELSSTPFLQKFMKKNDNVQNSFKNQISNNSKIQQSAINDSAFQIIDYGKKRIIINQNAPSQRKGQGHRLKGQKLDSRYNLVMSQYENSNIYENQNQNTIKSKQNAIKSKQKYKLFQINQQSPAKYQGNSSSGPKFQKITKVNNGKNMNTGNYINNVSLTNSKMVNSSNFINKSSSKEVNILNQFLKK